MCFPMFEVSCAGSYAIIVRFIQFSIEFSINFYRAAPPLRQFRIMRYPVTTPAMTSAHAHCKFIKADCSPDIWEQSASISVVSCMQTTCAFRLHESSCIEFSCVARGGRQDNARHAVASRGVAAYSRTDGHCILISPGCLLLNFIFTVYVAMQGRRGCRDGLCNSLYI